MNSQEASSVGSINYESEPVLEMQLEDVDYRLDVGLQGTAISVSQRVTGSWDWSFVGQAKWDNIMFRCKALPRPVCEALGKALKADTEADHGYEE